MKKILIIIALLLLSVAVCGCSPTASPQYDRSDGGVLSVKNTSTVHNSLMGVMHRAFLRFLHN